MILSPLYTIQSLANAQFYRIGELNKNKKMKTYIITLVEPNALLRQGLKSYLEAQHLIQQVMVYENFNTVGTTITQKAPDLLLFDTQAEDDFAKIRNLKVQFPEMKTLLLSAESRLRKNKSFAKTNWVDGFLEKNSSPEELTRFIFELLMEKEKDLDPKEENQTNNFFSDREIRVLELIAKGKTTKEASVMLNISRRTIEKHRQHIIEKVGGQNIIPALVWSVANNLIQLETDNER